MLKKLFPEISGQKKIIQGANGKLFEQAYWSDIYGRGDDVDGTFNAKEHARYLHSLFSLLKIRIRSIFDFGFGKGVLLREFSKLFEPLKIVAVDPSVQMVEAIRTCDWIRKYNAAIIHNSIQDLEPAKFKYAPFDLGICNSVLQYIPDSELQTAVEKISLLAKYVYFTVPTDQDYDRMKKEIKFQDPYAYHRSKNFYLKKLKPFFTFVSFNVLESRIVKECQFEDEIFRF
ncbi:MAG: class I SAM-dependent methyltransferase [Leptospira sp.]|nr:class I SAM-dependent methyltransferase [Leptospira sp.]